MFGKLTSFLQLLTTSLSALIVQSFLVIRAYRLSRSYAVVAGLSLLVLAGLGGGLATVGVIVTYPDVKDRGLLKVPVT